MFCEEHRTIDYCPECLDDQKQEKVNELEQRVMELELALSDLLVVAERCDGWESFPSEHLDKAHSALDRNTAVSN